MSRPARARARRRQHGAALLLAMLVVTLVAVFAATAVWQQWRSTEIEAADRARLQSDWILAGASDWARLILVEDARQGGPDHLSEPWAVPLMEARLSTFLAAERNVTIDADNVPQDAFLSGRIEDMQGRFNLTNLLQDGQLSAPDLQALHALFATLQLPDAQATQLADGWLRSSKTQAAGAGSDPGAAPLPARVRQLGWLGLPPDTVERLVPHVTILPVRTTINANTAGAEVLAAAVPSLAAGEAQRMVAYRAGKPFVSEAALREAFPALPARSGLGVSSSYFLVIGSLRMGAVTIRQQSLLQRTGLQTRLLWRERGSLLEGSPPSAAR